MFNTALFKKPIGILGGTFDPIHFGHIRLAQRVFQLLSPEKILFIPCFQPALSKMSTASPKQRLEMINLALQDSPEFQVDDREINRQGVSYTIDTVKSLQKDYPHKPLCFILGEDAFANFNQWHQWEKILNHTHLIIINRPSLSTISPSDLQPLLSHYFTKNLDDLRHAMCGKIYALSIPSIPISATMIREKCRLNLPLYDLVPKKVESYIKENRLYR